MQKEKEIYITHNMYKAPRQNNKKPIGHTKYIYK